MRVAPTLSLGSATLGVGAVATAEADGLAAVSVADTGARTTVDVGAGASAVARAGATAVALAAGGAGGSTVRLRDWAGAAQPLGAIANAQRTPKSDEVPHRTWRTRMDTADYGR